MPKINVDKITSDACAHAKIELDRIISDHMNNRRTDAWFYDWAVAAQDAIPAAIHVAISHALSDLVDQLDSIMRDRPEGAAQSVLPFLPNL